MGQLNLGLNRDWQCQFGTMRLHVFLSLLSVCIVISDNNIKDGTSVGEGGINACKEDEIIEEEKECWWEKEEEEEDQTKCAIDDKVGGRITPDTCNVWKKQGFCSEGKYKGWMQKNCFTTCNGCCADVHKNCPTWAKEGYCIKGGPRDEWMSKNCMKSCRGCCSEDDAMCMVKRVGKKMKTMGGKFKDSVMKMMKMKFMLAEKMEEMHERGMKKMAMMERKMEWMAKSMYQCGCNITTMPERPSGNWTKPEGSENPEGWTKPEGMTRPTKPEGVTKPEGTRPTKPEGVTKPEGTRPTNPEGTRPNKPEGTRPTKPEGVAKPERQTKPPPS